MAGILKSRKWTDGCFDSGLRAYYRLLVLNGVPVSRLHETGVDVEKCNAFAEDLKKRGVDARDHPLVDAGGVFFFIPDERIDRVECLLDLHRSQEGEMTLWSRDLLMSVMNPFKAFGGYALVKRTFDRLVKIGFDLDAKDFILLDEEEEEALEPFRRRRVSVEE